MQSHFWLGSLCYIGDEESGIKFPANVIAAADIITIIEDLGNKIPDKSWMLYLMEIFDGPNKVPIELNLICEFNDRNNFWAIFKGINRYRFTKVLPSVDHSYLRQLIMNKNSSSIEYHVTDLEDNTSEHFDFKVEDGQSLFCEGSAYFTGVEWWNKSYNLPFSIRYKIEVSGLKFGQLLDSGQIAYKPPIKLLPNKDGHALQYPISFDRPYVKDGCICYTLIPGICNSGLKFDA